MPKRAACLLLTLTLAACVTTATQPSLPSNQWPRPDWQLPAADARVWTQRIEPLLPPGWTLSQRDNTLIVTRDAPVQWRDLGINGPGFSSQAEADAYEKAHLTTGTYRLEFQFGPKMSLTRFDQLNADNAAIENERDQLRSTLNDVPHKFDSYIPATPQQTARLAAYHQALARRPFHTLPDLYSPDFSLAFTLSTESSRIYSQPVAQECQSVKTALFALFTPYPPPHGRAFLATSPWD